MLIFLKLLLNIVNIMHVILGSVEQNRLIIIHILL
jgi:hypothetical protein